jgi:5-hydroxyisourate hydrolase
MPVTVSTHVLDISLGKPAEGVSVSLGPHRKRTDATGRIAELASLEPGSYQLVFDLVEYFGGRPHLVNRVALEIRLDEGRHYHVPLLISPYSCSVYRGS